MDNRSLAIAPSQKKRADATLGYPASPALRIPYKLVSDFHRNRYSKCPGIVARFRPESLLDYPWNPCSICTGIRILAEDMKYADLDATNSQCLYISADASLLGSASFDKAKRDQVIATLLSISNLNCSTFLHRAFANRAAFDFGKKLAQDITTAASAATASASAPVSAVLDGVNLVVGKSVDSFNATYYFDKTFQAMEAAIDAERAQRRALVLARQADAEYSIAEALADIRAYDDACSIKAGLARLINVAEKSKDQNEKGKLEVQTSPSLTTYKTWFAK